MGFVGLCDARNSYMASFVSVQEERGPNFISEFMVDKAILLNE